MSCVACGRRCLTDRDLCANCAEIPKRREKLTQAQIEHLRSEVRGRMAARGVDLFDRPLSAFASLRSRRRFGLR